MPWAPLFTRRKQSVVIAGAQNAQLINLLSGVALPIRYRFASGAFLVQSGTLTTPNGFEAATCSI